MGEKKRKAGWRSDNGPGIRGEIGVGCLGWRAVAGGVMLGEAGVVTQCNLRNFSLHCSGVAAASDDDDRFGG